MRWSVPLPPPSATGTDVAGTSYPVSLNAQLGDGNIYQAETAIAPGLFVYQLGTAAVYALDPATGRHLWTARLPLPPGFYENNGPGLDVGLTIANGEVVAYDAADNLWWLMNATTGTVGGPYVFKETGPGDPISESAMLPVSSQSVVLVNTTQVQDFDPATNSVRWQVPVQYWSGETMIGDILYLDNSQYSHLTDTNGDLGNDSATAIQRVDLATGTVLPALPLAASLQLSEGQLLSDEDNLLLQTNAGTTVARLDPATGAAEWTFALPSTDDDAYSSYYRAIQLSGGAAGSLAWEEHPTVPGTGLDSYHIVFLNLDTGQATTTALGRSFPYAAAGLTAGDHYNGNSWNMDGSSILASESSGMYVRLEGLDPQTGHIEWRGPWSGNLYVLGESYAGPPIIIAQSCPPTGVQVDPQNTTLVSCDEARLYAVNA